MFNLIYCLLDCLFSDGIFQYMCIVSNFRMSKKWKGFASDCGLIWDYILTFTWRELESARITQDNELIRLAFYGGTYGFQAVVITAWASLLGGTMYCPTLGTRWMIYQIKVVPSKKGFMIEFRSWMTDRETIAIHTVLLRTAPNLDVKYLDSCSKSQNETKLERRRRRLWQENKSNESGWSIQ